MSIHLSILFLDGKVRGDNLDSIFPNVLFYFSFFMVAAVDNAQADCKCDGVDELVTLSIKFVTIP